MIKKIVFLVAIFLVAFALNFVWELAQMPLYDVPWEIWSLKCIQICFWATIWDASYVVVLYIILSIFNRNFYWLKEWNLKDIFWIIFIGLVTAAFVEIRALNMGDWAYRPNMPLLPFGIGLTPALQLPLLSVFSFFILNKLKNDRV